MNYIKKIILIFVIWRILLFLPLVYAQKYIPLQHDSIQYTLWAYVRPYSPVSSFLLYPWANFDGVHYLTIANYGSYEHGSDGRFFPLYPFLVHALTLAFGKVAIFGSVVFFTSFLVSNIAFLLGLIMLYKLIVLDFSEKIAFQTILLLLFFPTSFFFGSIYSESLFLLITVLIFYFLKKKKFFFATILSMALLVTRVVGIAIIPILIWEIIYIDRKIFHSFQKNKLHILKNIGLIALTPLALLGFIWVNQHYWGDPFFFIHAQEHVVTGRTAGLILFPQTMFRYVKILVSVPYSHFDWWISLLEFSSFIFTAVLLIYAYIKRIPLSYFIFSLLCFLLPTQSGTFSGLPRYTMILFPIFITFALIKNKYIKIAYYIVGAITMFFLIAFFSKGYYIA